MLGCQSGAASWCEDCWIKISGVDQVVVFPGGLLLVHDIHFFPVVCDKDILIHSVAIRRYFGEKIRDYGFEWIKFSSFRCYTRRLRGAPLHIFSRKLRANERNA